MPIECSRGKSQDEEDKKPSAGRDGDNDDDGGITGEDEDEFDSGDEEILTKSGW